LTKGQFLAAIRDKSTQLTVEVSDDMKLHRHGDTVVVTGSTHEKGTEKGKPFLMQAASPTPGSRKTASGFASLVS